jgi:hypothetical protein
LPSSVDDGEHLLRRRGDPDFVGAAHFGFAHVAELERQARALRELDDHVVGDAGRIRFDFGGDRITPRLTTNTLEAEPR